MKQIQAMQDEMQRRVGEARDKLRSTVVKGSAGGELIEVEMNGERELLRVSVKPELFNSLVIDNSLLSAETNLKDTAQELADLIFAATNSALAQANKLYEEVMSSVAPTQGMDFSNLGDLLSMLK